MPGKPWTLEQDNQLKAAVAAYRTANPGSKRLAWKEIAESVTDKNYSSCKSRWPIIDPARKRSSEWEKSELSTLLEFLRDFTRKSGKQNGLLPAITEALNRDNNAVRNLYIDKVVPSLKKRRISIGDDGKYLIGRGEAFTETLNAVWKDIQPKYKRHKPTCYNRTGTAAAAANISEIIATKNAETEANNVKLQEKEAKLQEKAAERKRVLETVKEMRITDEEKAELENPNSKEPWVLRYRECVRTLMALGWSKQELDELVEFYRSKSDEELLGLK